MFTRILKKISSSSSPQQIIEPIKSVVLNKIENYAGADTDDNRKEIFNILTKPNSQELNEFLKYLSAYGSAGDLFALLMIDDYQKLPTLEKADYIFNKCLVKAESMQTTSFDEMQPGQKPSLALNADGDGIDLSSVRDELRSKLDQEHVKSQNIKRNRHLVYTRPNPFIFRNLMDKVRRELYKQQINGFINNYLKNDTFIFDETRIKSYSSAIELIRDINQDAGFMIPYSNLK